MADSLADGITAVVLAAGDGRRLRPLTDLLPKALCPVGGVALVDRAIVSVRRAVGGDVAVNVHHGRDAMLAHLDGGSDVHVSVEEPVALGTAGALAAMSGWLDGRSALVVNADTVHDEDLAAFVGGWDGERVRILMVGEPPFGPRSGVVASIVPAWAAADLRPEPSGLWEVMWRSELEAGRIDAVAASGVVIDCGTPAQYLRANLHVSGGATVIGDGAIVLGVAERSVLWPGTVVREGEHLRDAVRADMRRTVLVR